MVRFGEWEAVLAEPKPPEKWHYMTGIWHYARGMAYAHTDRLDPARKELETLQAITLDPMSGHEMVGFGSAPTLLTIASEVLAGELAAKQKRFDVAISHLGRAVRLEDSLMYNEPPDWYYPVRHTLGAVLIEAGYPAEAEVVYWQDLKRYRDNGYSLYGLWQSLKAQGRDTEAAKLMTSYNQAWAHADRSLSSSRF